MCDASKQTWQQGSLELTMWLSMLQIIFHKKTCLMKSILITWSPGGLRPEHPVAAHVLPASTHWAISHLYSWQKHPPGPIGFAKDNKTWYFSMTSHHCFLVLVSFGSNPFRPKNHLTLEQIFMMDSRRYWIYQAISYFICLRLKMALPSFGGL